MKDTAALFSGRSLRTQITLVFALLVAGLTVLLPFGFGELHKQRIEHDAGATLATIAHNASRQLAQGLLERSRSIQVLADSGEIWTRGLVARCALPEDARSWRRHRHARHPAAPACQFVWVVTPAHQRGSARTPISWADSTRWPQDRNHRFRCAGQLRRGRDR